MAQLISLGTEIMNRETCIILGRVTRITNHFYQYESEPKSGEYLHRGRIRRDRARAVIAKA